MILRGYYEPQVWVSVLPAVVKHIDANPDPRYVACTVRVREQPQHTFTQEWPKDGCPS